jgi:hypothetical protein
MTTTTKIKSRTMENKIRVIQFNVLYDWEGGLRCTQYWNASEVKGLYIRMDHAGSLCCCTNCVVVVWVVILYSLMSDYIHLCKPCKRYYELRHTRYFLHKSIGSWLHPQKSWIDQELVENQVWSAIDWSSELRRWHFRVSADKSKVCNFWSGHHFSPYFGTNFCQTSHSIPLI